MKSRTILGISAFLFAFACIFTMSISQHVSADSQNTVKVMPTATPVPNPTVTPAPTPNQTPTPETFPVPSPTNPSDPTPNPTPRNPSDPMPSPTTVPTPK